MSSVRSTSSQTAGIRVVNFTKGSGLNGWYKLVNETHRGWPLFQHTQNPERWVRKNCDGMWTISSTESKDSRDDNAYCCLFDCGAVTPVTDPATTNNNDKSTNTSVVNGAMNWMASSSNRYQCEFGSWEEDREKSKQCRSVAVIGIAPADWAAAQVGAEDVFVLRVGRF